MKQSFSLAGYPAVRILLMLLLGAFFGAKATILFPEIYISAVFAIFSGIFLASCILAFYQKTKSPKWILIARRINYLVVLLLVGFIVGMLHSLKNKELDKSIAFWNSHKWEELSFSGSIENVQDAAKGRYIIAVDSLYVNHQLIKAPKVKALISIAKSEQLSTGFKNLGKGDSIRAVAKILPVETRKMAGKTFDQQKWLKQLGVDTRWSVQTLYAHTKTSEISIIEQSRAFVSGNLHAFFAVSPKLLALAKAMILADKSLITGQTRRLYQQTGLSHVLAVSGFHVSMLLLPLWWFMPRFWLNNKRKWLYLSVATSLMIFYVLLTGSPASVQRATIMAWFLLVGRLWHFNGPPINMLAFAAIIMIARNPATVFDVGFQLSFAAVSSIFLVFQPIEQLFSHDFRSTRWYKWLLSSLLFTFTLQAAMFPLTAYYFGEHAHLGPIANLLYLPFLTFCLFPLFIVSATSAFLFPAAISNYIVGLFDAVYTQLERFLFWLCEFPIATNQVVPPSFLSLLGIFCLVISLNYWSKPRVRWRAICIALLCFNLTTFS